jgi:hypothetical protein
MFIINLLKINNYIKNINNLYINECVNIMYSLPLI